MIYYSFWDLNKNELRNARIQNLGTPPTNPVMGQIFFNTAVLAVWCWNGTSWDDIGGAIKNIVKASGSPLTVTVLNGVATLDIVAATQIVAGSMSAADKLKLDSASANNIASTLVIRDASGNAVLNQLTSSKVTGLAAGVNPSDAVNKAQLDAVASGLDAKGSVRVATTANITLSGAQTVDGVSLAIGDRVLVKNQGSGVANGVYIVAASTWSRATDLATAATAKSAYFFVNEGAVNGDTGWLCISDGGADVVGTNNLNFTQFTSTGTITGGAGLLKTGNQSQF